MPKKHIANHFADWMKRIGERLSDLESNYKDLDSRHEELYSRYEELSEKVDELEGELAAADSRIDDLGSEDRELEEPQENNKGVEGRTSCALSRSGHR